VFRNPPGEFAGGIIDRLGLKGLSRGGAQISSRHANFIVNAGGASATDVLALIREVRRRVVEATGIHLDLEIRVVGEDR
jgi:UDP-N-acetylmuramate dehydrogenase